ncbi:MucR family transcriptional regulator [Catellatospora sp. NPDC049111]|uniref:MucR family transcriptional regulator n=1 Tax=Catellatospora sp. NPDC049111 TaxID=3155271 RepID=UPI00340529EC
MAQLEQSPDGQHLLCHECGQWKRALGTHAWHVHGLSADDYRRRHGLSTGQSLAAAATRQRLSEMPQAQPGSSGRAALERHRDPARARAAMTADGQHRAQLVDRRAHTGAVARRGRALTDT